MDQRKGVAVKTLCGIFLVLIMAGTASAQLAPYWIPDDGCTLLYEIDGNGMTLEAFAPLGFTQSAAGNWAAFSFVFDTEGDVCWSEYDWYEPSGNPNPQHQWFEPPLKILDYPLTTDKTWQATATEMRTGYPNRTLTTTGTVLGPQTVETGLGTLDVIAVRIDYTYSDYTGSWSKTYYLHDQLGHVLDLVALTDCDVTPVEPTTWGTIKAMYE